MAPDAECCYAGSRLYRVSKKSIALIVVLLIVVAPKMEPTWVETLAVNSCKCKTRIKSMKYANLPSRWKKITAVERFMLQALGDKRIIRTSCQFLDIFEGKEKENLKKIRSELEKHKFKEHS